MRLRTSIGVRGSVGREHPNDERLELDRDTGRMLSHRCEMAARRGDGKTSLVAEAVDVLYRSGPHRSHVNLRASCKSASVPSWHAPCTMRDVTRRVSVCAGWTDRYRPVSHRSTLPGVDANRANDRPVAITVMVSRASIRVTQDGGARLWILTFVRMTEEEAGARDFGRTPLREPQLAFCVSNNCASSPLSYISIMMSEPPTNSPPT
jgi:hypothetical protein